MDQMTLLITYKKYFSSSPYPQVTSVPSLTDHKPLKGLFSL